MALSDVLGLVGLVVALVAFGIAARWNHLNEASLARLDGAMRTLDQRNQAIARNVVALNDAIAALDNIRRILGRAAMASTPESFIMLSVAEASDGLAFGDLCELAYSRRYGQHQMYEAAHVLQERGFIDYDAPLTPSTLITSPRSDAAGPSEE